MISVYKWKKYAVLITLGIVPLMIFLMIFFPTIRFYTIEGMQLMYLDITYVLISVMAGILTAVILMLFGIKLLRHSFTDMLEGKGLLTLVLDSTGVIGSFNVKVKTPKLEGFPNKNMPPIEDTYDMDLLHRLMVPKTVGMTKAISFKKDLETEEITLGETVDVLVLPKQEGKYDNTFMFENRPVFVFNKVMNKFLSRDALSLYEKDIEIRHNALNILKAIQETARDFKTFGRYIGENIKPKKSSIFASPIIKYILIGAVVFFILILVMMFIPGILSATSNIGMP